MIGLIIITHGNLAIELKTSLEHVIGPQKNLETISIGYEDEDDLKVPWKVGIPICPKIMLK